MGPLSKGRPVRLPRRHTWESDPCSQTTWASLLITPGPGLHAPPTLTQTHQPEVPGVGLISGLWLLPVHRAGEWSWVTLGNMPGIHAAGLQSHVPGSSCCPGGQPLLGVCSPWAGRREDGRWTLAVTVCQDPAGPGRPRLEAEPGWVGGGVRQRAERVQRPGEGTARHSARDAVQVCEDVPRTSTLQTLSVPPTPTRPA